MKIHHLSFVALSAACFATTSLADDWGMWRGPQANGISQESITPSHDIAWTKEVGDGYSAVSVFDGKAITAGNVDGQDIIYCLDPATGKEIWTYSQSSEGGRRYPGALSTPVTDGKMIWYFDRHGTITCLDFASGKKLWSRMMVSDSAYMPRWSIAGSVRIYKDLAIVSVGEYGAAVNKETGEPVWASDGMGSYCTPSIFTFKGKDYMAVHGGMSTSVVDPVDGTLFDQKNYELQYDIIGASPIIVDEEKGLFFVSMGYRTGRAILYSFDGQKMEEVWNVTNMNSQFSSPILKDGVIYGSNGNTNDRNTLAAIDVSNGETLWTGTQRFGSPLIVGDILVYLDERGTLTYLNVDKTKESIISSGDVLSGGKSWQMPVVADGYLYCRNSLGTLVCIKVK